MEEWKFRSLELKLEKPVFIPRPETEQLIDIAKKLWPETYKDPLHFCEVGCGSGAISLSILKFQEFPNSKGVAIDVSLSALKLTQNNFFKNFDKESTIEERLELIQTNFSNFAQNSVTKFDFIISNPPYIPTETYLSLERQVIKYEDKRALDGGKYGLDVIWDLIRKSGDELKVGGYLIMETDEKHPEYLKEYFKDHQNIVHDLKIFDIQKDLFGKPRFVILQKVAKKEKVEKVEKLIIPEKPIEKISILNQSYL